MRRDRLSENTHDSGAYSIFAGVPVDMNFDAVRIWSNACRLVVRYSPTRLTAAPTTSSPIPRFVPRSAHSRTSP